MHSPSNSPQSDIDPAMTEPVLQASAERHGMLASASREFHDFVTDVEDLLKATSLVTGDELSRVKARLSQRVATARASAEKIGDALALQARQTASVTNDYVHEQPWQGIAVGGLLGLVSGWLVARRRAPFTPRTDAR